MSRFFIDTSFLVALKDSSDDHHAETIACLEELLRKPKIRLVLTNYVLSEVHAYFCRTPEVALEYVNHLKTDPSFQIIRAGARDERKAEEILRRSLDKSYSYADAVSFAVMARLGIRSALALDRHFKQHGQQVLP